MILSIFPRLLDWQFYGPTLLRLALGAIVLAHGWQKLSGDKTQLAGWVEFLGGILLVIGLWTQLAALILAIEFLVIIFWIQRGKPFIGGREFDFLILFTLLSILVLGPGAWSIDLPL